MICIMVKDALSNRNLKAFKAALRQQLVREHCFALEVRIIAFLRAFLASVLRSNTETSSKE